MLYLLSKAIGNLTYGCLVESEIVAIDVAYDGAIRGVAKPYVLVGINVGKNGSVTCLTLSDTSIRTNGKDYFAVISLSLSYVLAVYF